MTRDKDQQTKRRRDVLVVCVLVALALAGYAAWRVWTGAQEPGVYAVIHDGDGGVTALPLDDDTQVRIQTSKGYNVVAVTAGSVSVVDADCDNHDCIRQGSIAREGQQIICLPHELWIEITSSAEGSGAQMDTGAVNSSGIDTVSR